MGEEDGVTIWGPARGRSPLPQQAPSLAPGPLVQQRTASPRRLELPGIPSGPGIPAMTIEPPTPTMEEGPKMRRVKRVIKKKDPEAKKEEMRKEGEEFLRSKVAMVDEGKGAKADETNNNREQADKVGVSVAEKSNEKVAN